jgi:hypothetical protein
LNNIQYYKNELPNVSTEFPVHKYSGQAIKDKIERKWGKIGENRLSQKNGKPALDSFQP